MSIFEDMVLDEKDRQDCTKAIMDEIERLPADTLRECFGTESAEELFSLGKFDLVEKIYNAYKTRKGEPILKFGDTVMIVNVFKSGVDITGIVFDYDSGIEEYGVLVKSPEEARDTWGPLAIIYIPRKHIAKLDGYITSITKSTIDWLKG